MSDLVPLISELSAEVLPPGRVVTSGDDPLFWVSDDPVSVDVWLRFLYLEWQPWPVLLPPRDPRHKSDEPLGDVFSLVMTAPDQYDVPARMAKWWQDYTSAEEDDGPLDEEVTAPFGREWPGLAPSSPTEDDPDDYAYGYAKFLLSKEAARLGLVAVPRGSDALWKTGWSAPANYDNDSGVFAAVVRDWEHRFGVRVVAMGPSTLNLSVATPPMSMEQAQRVAAEHFAFCPDALWQGGYRTLEAYAGNLLERNGWEFWWD